MNLFKRLWLTAVIWFEFLDERENTLQRLRKSGYELDFKGDVVCDLCSDNCGQCSDSGRMPIEFKNELDQQILTRKKRVVEAWH